MQTKQEIDKYSINPTMGAIWRCIATRIDAQCLVDLGQCAYGSRGGGFSPDVAPSLLRENYYERVQNLVVQGRGAKTPVDERFGDEGIRLWTPPPPPRCFGISPLKSTPFANYKGKQKIVWERERIVSFWVAEKRARESYATQIMRICL